MLFTFTLPELGENIVKGKVVKVLAVKGKSVSKGDTLIEVETDKAVIEVPSPVGGKITNTGVKAGQTIDVGSLVAEIETKDVIKKIPSKSQTVAESPEGKADIHQGRAAVRMSPSMRKHSRADLPDFSQWGKIRRTELSELRKAVARNVTFSWQTIPHVTQFDEASIASLTTFRKKEGKISITAILAKITVDALKKFPQFNASLDMQAGQVVYKNYFHIGIAVDTEHGLIVPVIRDADKKSLQDLAREIGDSAERARARRMTLAELEGGSFVITNLGGLGTTYFTPIIQWPQVAILGVGRATGGMMPLAVSYDHRLIDGADAARFLRFICEGVEHVS